ncbi:MAG: hypothetical protein K8U57_19060 [Planctomycetes bacterium]|nr:hypothetical protein [Planctomycetota bacterium]
MRSQSKFIPRVEALDDRSLMSVTLSGGLLTVVGTTGADQIRVTLASPTMLQVTVDTTGDNQQFSLSAVNNILIRALAGDDNVVVGPSIPTPAEIRAWAGNDTVLGGGGSDKILGGGGNDYLQGRGGSDEIRGQADDDYLLGQGGNDYLDGQGGNDLLLGGSGSNTLVNGTNLDLQFSVPGVGGTGTVSLLNDTPGNPLAKTLTVSGQGAPGGVANIFIGSFFLGQFSDPSGFGTVVYHQNYDTNFDGLPDFLEGVPSTFPEITNDTVLTAHVISPIDESITATVGELLGQVGA